MNDDIVLQAFASGFRLGREAEAEAPHPVAVLAVEETVGELQRQLADLERRLIRRAYDEGGGVKTEIAKLLGIKTSALYYKLEKYGIGTIAKRGPVQP